MQQVNTKEELSIIYQDYSDSLYSYGCKFTNDSELVKDCIHDVFIRIFEKKNISEIQNIKFYLLRSFRNRMFDELSKIHTIEITNEVPFSVSGNSTAEDQLLEDEETKLIKEQVNNAMNTLTSRQREAIYLYYIEELSYDQICLLLDMNYQSVRNLIHRGMTRLRENMDRKTFLFL